ncbi:MAG: rhodanese-like domain-containing protein [Undibacterium sp.]|nr:rhodanese-like domain-containing protein [Undibacterium sp.]
MTTQVTTQLSNPVLATPAADSQSAIAHFSSTLQFETDCWDTHHALESENPGFVLLDVRSPEAYAQGHVPGAINLLRGKIIPSKLAAYPSDTLFVTYCAGPHCNGATKAAIVLAKLGRPVKIMIGGITGWIDEGFSLTKEPRDLQTN